MLSGYRGSMSVLDLLWFSNFPIRDMIGSMKPLQKNVPATLTLLNEETGERETFASDEVGIISVPAGRYPVTDTPWPAGVTIKLSSILTLPANQCINIVSL
jgi:hypothetical protein